MYNAKSQHHGKCHSIQTRYGSGSDTAATTTRLRKTRIDPVRPALHIDQRSGIHIRQAQRLGLISRRRCELGHRILQTLRASRHAARWQIHAQRQVIDVRVCGAGGVGHGVGVAVVAALVVEGGRAGFKAAGTIEDVVGYEAVVSLADGGVLAVIVLGAGGGGAKAEGVGGHEGGTGGEDYIT